MKSFLFSILLLLFPALIAAALPSPSPIAEKGIIDWIQLEDGSIIFTNGQKLFLQAHPDAQQEIIWESNEGFISNLLVSQDPEIDFYFIFQDQKVYQVKLNHTEHELIALNIGNSGGRLSGIYESKAGSLFLVFSDGYIWDVKANQLYPTKFTLGDCVYHPSTQTLIAVTDSQIVEISPILQMTPPKIIHELKGNTAKLNHGHHKEGVWISTSDDSLFYWSPEQGCRRALSNLKFLSHSGHPFQIDVVLPVENGMLTLGSQRDGILKVFYDPKTLLCTSVDHFSVPGFRSMFLDHEGILRIGIQNNAALEDPDPWNAWMAKPKGVKGKLTAVLKDKNGGFFLATNKGLYHIECFGQCLNRLKRIMWGDITAVFQDHNHTLWIGTMKRGLFRLDRGHVLPKRFLSPQALDYRIVKTIATTQDRHVWLRFPRKIMRVNAEDNNNRLLFDAWLQAPHDPPPLLYSWADSSVLAGLYERPLGVIDFSGNSSYPIGPLPGPPTACWKSDSGIYLFGALNHGLFFGTAGEGKLTKVDSLHARIILDIQPLSHDSVLVLHEKGGSLVYGMESGKIKAETFPLNLMQNPPLHPGARSPDGRFFYSRNDSILTLRPHRLWQKKKAGQFKVYIVVNGKRILATAEDSPQIPYNTPFAIVVDNLSWHKQEALRWRGWIGASEHPKLQSETDSLTYPYASPGPHSLTIEVKLGGVSLDLIQLPISVNRPLFHRPVFVIFLYLLFGLLVWIAARLRTRFLRSQNKQLEKLLQEIEVERARNDAMLNALPDIMFVIDQDLNVSEYRCNSDAELEAELAKAIPGRIVDLLKPTQTNSLEDYIAKVQNGSAKESFPFRVPFQKQFRHYHARMSFIENTQDIIVLARDITEKVLRDEKETNHKRKLAEAEFQAQEAEKKRLASNLHDDLGPVITTAIHRINLLKPGVPDTSSELYQSLDFIKTRLQQALEITRKISHGMVPQALLLFGLRDGLQETIQDMNESVAPTMEFHFQGTPDCEPHMVSLVVYRVTLTLVQNAIRHAAASRIDVKIDQEADKITVVIKDDGKGFDLKKARTRPGLGLYSLEKRVKDFGGHFHIATKPGHGTVITFRIPYAPPAEEDDQSESPEES